MMLFWGDFAPQRRRFLFLPGSARRLAAAERRHLFIIHYSLFTLHLAPPPGELSPKGTEGATTAVSFLGRRLRRRRLASANLPPPGPPRPRPRVTFWPARKSPKSRLREGGFRFPPSLKNPISLKRPRPGASAPALDPTPDGRKPGNSSLFTIHYSLTDSTILLKPGAYPLSHGCAVPAPPPASRK